MTIQRILAMTALPLLAVTLGLMNQSQADAGNASRLMAQNSPQQTRPQGQRRTPPRIDFAAAASKLGISEAQLKEALGVPANPPSVNDPKQRPPRPDFKAAAAKLGISEQTLIQALGIPPRPPGPNFAAAAQKLGVSEAQLKSALGVPANPPNPGDRQQRPPRPDLKTAAAKLGVTEQQLVQALGVPPHPPGGDRVPNPTEAPPATP